MASVPEPPVLGSAPDATAAVRSMFAEISPRYDFLNHVLSLNLDRLWRRRAARAGLAASPRRILDLATGTGDLALTLRRRAAAPLVVGLDACLPMLDVARAKAARRAAAVSFAAGDALALPFRDAAFDLVTVAFGLRNVANRAAALTEIRRVTAPGGRLVVLEFSMDLASWFAPFYRVYLRRVLPALGRAVSGSDAYAYLNRSVEAFPPPPEVAAAIHRVGFAPVTVRRLAAGAVSLYVAGPGAATR